MIGPVSPRPGCDMTASEFQRRFRAGFSEKVIAAGSTPVQSTPAGRSHFNAKRTVCEAGHAHPSKAEARVCASVYAEFSEEVAEWGYRILRNVRLPLWSLPPTDAGLPHYCNVDFAIYAPHEATEIGFRRKSQGALVALIDAKCGRRSRDWERGRAAVEATYGIRVEERTSAAPPAREVT